VRAFKRIICLVANNVATRGKSQKKFISFQQSDVLMFQKRTKKQKEPLCCIISGMKQQLNVRVKIYFSNDDDFAQ
jgi:hypothetical protein